MWESRFESDVIPSDMGEGLWNRNNLGFRGCESMIDGSKLLGNNRTGLLSPGEQPLLPLVFGSLVLELELGQGLHHTSYEGLVLHHSVSLDLPPLRGCERHQSWDGP